ncbi:hypothetical protein ACFQO6_04315, partial [Nocardioides astragali]
MKSAESSAHSNAAPASLENVNAAPELMLGSVGAESMVVCGAVVSMVHVYVAGLASVLPAWSVAR